MYILSVMLLPIAIYGQAEAESAVTDGLVQSRSNGRTKDIEIGSTIKYRLEGDSKFSERYVFGGIIGDAAIIGKDTIDIDKLESIKPRHEKNYRTGKNLFWAGVIIRGISIIAVIAIVLASFSSIGGLILAGLLGLVLNLVGLPLFYTGLIMMLVASRTFDVRRLWKLKAGRTRTRPKLKL